MKLTSPAFGQNEPIPAIHTCDGDDVLPPLMISDVPEEAVSLALIVDDPDAPGGSWIHWAAWNLPASTTHLAASELPEAAIQGRNSFGRNDYGGPCPPSGEHRYFFKLFALDRQLELPASATAADLESAMQAGIIDKAGLIGTYRSA
jgi:Raf kinase inhibitor-like YbhB/YbcL family protein